MSPQKREKRRVLLTGAGGLLGSAVAQVWEPACALARRTHAELDVTDSAALARTLDAVRPETIVHCAAFTDVDGAESRKEEAEALNHHALSGLARMCAEREILLVSFGSDYVFDGKLRRPYREEDEPRPLSAYGKSKLSGEEAVREAGCAYLLLRVQALYGEGARNLVARLLAAEDPQAEFFFADDRFSQPTWARDVAEAVLDLWRADARGLIHVANKGPLTWYRFARLLQEKAKRPAGRITAIAAEDRKEPARRPAYSALDVTLCEGLLRRPMRSVEEALDAYLAHRKSLFG